MTTPTIKPNQSVGPDHFPGMGEQYVIGAVAAGIQTVTTTLGANSNMTHAQLIASPPNTDGVSKAFGPVVHSHGVPPTLAWAQPVDQSLGVAPAFVFVTADNSAVYFQVYAARHTGTNPVGVAARVIIMR